LECIGTADAFSAAMFRATGVMSDHTGTCGSAMRTTNPAGGTGGELAVSAAICTACAS
jgi:hypothetical protein